MVAISPIDTGRPERTVARRAGTSTGRRAGLFLGRCSRPTICLPTVEALPASHTRSHIARSPHGAREAHCSAENGNTATLQGSRLYGKDLRRYLWRFIAQFARACRQACSARSLVKGLRLLFTALGRAPLGTTSLASPVPGPHPLLFA